MRDLPTEVVVSSVCFRRLIAKDHSTCSSSHAVKHVSLPPAEQTDRVVSSIAVDLVNHIIAALAPVDSLPNSTAARTTVSAAAQSVTSNAQAVVGTLSLSALSPMVELQIAQAAQAAFDSGEHLVQDPVL